MPMDGLGEKSIRLFPSKGLQVLHFLLGRGYCLYVLAQIIDKVDSVLVV